ncbi:InlB B-repeat-containing protein [Epilithonimonas sp.]|uniref:InlB B-repeat-containing protein n=1 Tax=Epilithonimonas sp. TaxID=2894511 RepID=UPI0028A2804F|nr:InlB B-repeat-containing protein [Epilithonimonas sp.]
MKTNLFSQRLPFLIRSLKVFLVLFAVWANAQSITLTASAANAAGAALGSTNYGSGAERTWTQSSVGFGGKAITGNSGTPTAFQCQASNGVIYNTTAFPGKITKIEVTQSGTNRAATVYGGAVRLVNNTTADYAVGGTSIGTLSISTATSTITPAANTSYTFFAIKVPGSATYFTQIVITYEMASYTVTFNGNGSTSGTMSSQSASSATNLTNNAFAKTGYAFGGWASSVANATAGTVAYDNQDQYPFTSSTTLYAVWGFNVTYNSNGGSGTIAAQTGYYNSTTGSGAVNLSTGSGFTRPGYAFAGWKASAAGTAADYLGGATYTHSGSSVLLALFAHWTINSYTITYNANSSTSGSIPASQSGDYNTTVNLQSNSGGLVKDGYVFTGWNTAPNGSGTHYNENANFTIPASSTTLYAEWKLIASYSGISAGAAVEPATISSLINSQGDSVLNFDFTVTDDSNITDGNDDLPTLISQIIIPQGAGNDVGNWTQAIEGAILSDGTNAIAGTVNATNMTFTSIPVTVNSLGYVADGDNKTYTLKIWLKTALAGTLPTTIDGLNLEFKVDRSNFATASSATSTQFEAGTGTAVESGANNNAVEVTATNLSFVQQPSNTTVNTNMSPAVTISANDVNGNRDRDYTTSVVLTSTGTLTGTPVAVNPVSGLATFSTLRHTAAGTNLKLAATSSSFSNIESSTFNIALVTASTDYFKSRATGAWATAANWESSPDGSTWITSSLVPTSSATAINILSGHTITISTAAAGKNITVEAGGVLNLNSGLTTSGTNVVNGTWNQTSTTAIANTGTLAFGEGAIYNHNVNGGTIPTATWDDSSNCNVIGFTGSGNITGLAGIGQNFGNLTINNAMTGYLNLFSAAGSITVRGTLTVGPLSSNLVSFGNSNFGVTANINRINLTGGALHGVGSGTTLTLNVATDLVIENSGAFRSSTGSGNAIVTIGNDVLLKDNASLELVAGTSTAVTSQILNVTRDFVIDGIAATLNLRSNTSTSTTVGAGIVNVGRNFSSNNTDADAVDVDFGTAGTVTNNYIAITGNLTHTGNGVYQTSANGQARGFVFRGTASAPSLISYSGENSEYTSYEVDTNYYAKLNTDLTLGSSTVSPISYFTVKGNLDFGDRSIIGNSAARFNTASGATLNTSNLNGIGGVSTTGSLRSFSSTNSTAANGRAQFIAGINYIFNANTNAPFPTGTIGNPESLTFNNVEVMSNRTGSLIVSGAVNINGTSKFSLNSAGNNLNLGGVMTIGENAAFDNNGENQITSGGGAAAIIINGTFVTKDAQGFTGSNSSVPTVPVTVNAGSTIHYALDGAQTVSSRADYQNLLFTGNGTKSTTGSIATIAGTVTINGTNTILDVSNNTFGNSATGLTMTAGTFRLAGSGTKPDISGTYNLSLGTNIEFTGTAATQIRLAPHYANVVVSGSNIVAGTTTNGGLIFQENGNFTVKNGARFKVNNDNGFSGSTTTAIKNTNNPTIVLETGSTIDYTGNNQIVTNELDYHNLTISTAGTKTASPGTVVANGLTTVSAGTLKISETEDHTTTNVLYAHKGIANLGGTVSFGSNAQLMQDADAVNGGNISSARKSKLPKMGYTYWSSPVSSQNLYAFSNGGQTGGTPKNRFWVYDEATNLFKNTGAFLLNDSSVFESGRGYAIRGMDDFGATTPAVSHEFLFTGVPNNGNVSFQYLKWTNDDKGYNLVGNPYPSNIDFDGLYNANASKIHPIAYFWTNNDMSVTQQQSNYAGNNYAIYNLTGGSPAVQVEGDPNQPSSGSMAPTNIIKVGQGFIVKTKTGMNDQPLDFANTIRLTDNGVFFNNKLDMEKDRFWLKMISPTNISNTLLLGYMPAATNGYELAYDTELFIIGSDSFYSLLDGKKLGIQGRTSFVKDDRVALGNVYSQNGNYRIAVIDKQGIFANGQSIYLKDKLLNKVVEITNTDYIFQAVKGTDNTRFEIIYKAEDVLNVGNASKTDLIVYKDHNEQVIRSSKRLGKIEVYDASGKLMQVLNVNGTETRIDTSAFSTGVYILKIENSGDVKTKKFIK